MYVWTCPHHTYLSWFAGKHSGRNLRSANNFEAGFSILIICVTLNLYLARLYILISAFNPPLQHFGINCRLVFDPTHLLLVVNHILRHTFRSNLLLCNFTVFIILTDSFFYFLASLLATLVLILVFDYL